MGMLQLTRKLFDLFILFSHHIQRFAVILTQRLQFVVDGKQPSVGGSQGICQLATVFQQPVTGLPDSIQRLPVRISALQQLPGLPGQLTQLSLALWRLLLMAQAGVDGLRHGLRSGSGRYWPAYAQCCAYPVQSGFPVCQQPGIVHTNTWQAPAALFTVPGITQPQQVCTRRGQWVTVTQGCADFCRGAGCQNHHRLPARLPGGRFPEGQQQAQAGILDHGQGCCPGKCRIQERHSLILKPGDGLTCPHPRRQGPEVIPASVQGGEQLFVDGDQLPVLPKTSRVDILPGTEKILSHIGAKKIQHPREHRSAAAVHTQHQDQYPFLRHGQTPSPSRQNSAE